MSATLAFASLMLMQQAPAAAASYEEAVRCAGLSQAASELEGGESAEGGKLYDAALYWSLTANQSGMAAGKTTHAVDADQTRARIEAVRQLNADAPAARAALQHCLHRTPNLD